MPIPARAIYDIIKKLSTTEEFTKFARKGLEIPDHEINHIKEKYQGQPSEQKFQMVLKWEMMNGRNATRIRLYEIYNEFAESEKDPQQAIGSQREDVPGNERVSASHNNQAANYGAPQVSHLASQHQFRGIPPEAVAQFLAQYSIPNIQAPSSSTISGSPLAAQQTTSNPANNNQARGSLGSTVTGNVVQASGSVANYEAHSTQPVAGVLTRATHQSARVVGGPVQLSNPVPVQQNLCVEVDHIHVMPCTEEKNRQIRQENDSVYPMQYREGLVVIINNNFRGEEGERIGAEEDVKHLKELWDQLGCKVIVAQDRTCEQILNILKHVAQITEKYNYLAIFVMSHGGMQGDTEVILGSDGTRLSVKNILLQFKNEGSQNWIGIPKLFFFQFCRGTNVDEGIECDLENVFSAFRDHWTELDQADYLESGQRQSHCSRSDMFISYATLSGDAAFRNSKGSWFINAIVHVFMKFAWKEHMNELMLRVRRAVSEKTGLTAAENGSVITCKEMSESVDRLRFKLYLLYAHRA